MLILKQKNSFILSYILLINCVIAPNLYVGNLLTIKFILKLMTVFMGSLILTN